MSNNKKLQYNTLASGANQIINVLYGLIVPQMIILYYGSSVNGLQNSISNFLSIIAICDCGVSTVIQSALYEPLAKNKPKEINSILSASTKFFNVILWILIIYNVLLVLIYPIVVHNEFDFLYTSSLIAAIGISSFSQYYFGIVDNILLQADQKAYISEVIQGVSLLLIIIVSVVEIKLGMSIQVVKLTTSLIFLLRPVFLRLYVNQHYSIDRKYHYEHNPIEQKWNGLAQHIAAIVLNNTPVIVLTFLATLQDVSIYAVYAMIVLGVKALFLSLTNGIRPYIGELWAKQELEELNNVFDWSEWVIHTTTVIIFGSVAILIVPFVKVYTVDVHDANYIVPLFAAFFTLAHAFHSLRLPYNIMILACNHYKQTQNNYFIVAIINIVVSIVGVLLWGLIGVAIGAFISLAYQTIWMAKYCSVNFIKRPMRFFIKQSIVDILVTSLAVTLSLFVKFSNLTYSSWLIYSIEILVLFVLVSLFVNGVLYTSKIRSLYKRCCFNRQ